MWFIQESVHPVSPTFESRASLKKAAVLHFEPDTKTRRYGIAVLVAENAGRLLPRMLKQSNIRSYKPKLARFLDHS